MEKIERDLIKDLGLRQRILEQLLATLVLWLALLTTTIALLSWFWLEEVPAAAVRRASEALWDKLSGIGAFLGLAGCVAVAASAWWIVDTLLQRWLDGRQFAAMRR